VTGKGRKAKLFQTSPFSVSADVCIQHNPTATVYQARLASKFALQVMLETKDDHYIKMVTNTLLI
jgi:hypothetical protein